MPAITVHNDEVLDKMWVEHLSALRAAEAAAQAAAGLESDADTFRAESEALRAQSTEVLEEAVRRAHELINEAQRAASVIRQKAQEKDDAAKEAGRRSADARREEKRQLDISDGFARTVDSQAELNSNLTHPRTRYEQKAVTDAFRVDPLATAPDGNGLPQLASDLPGTLVASGNPLTPEPPVPAPDPNRQPS